MQGHIKLVLLPLLFIAAFSFPDKTALSQIERPTDCDPYNSSRLPSAMKCGEEPEVLSKSYELDKTITILTPATVSRDCAAQVDVQYFQKDTFASVEATIENEYCAASSGTYVLSIRTVDENGEQNTQEIMQQWSREDDQPATVTADIPIGENVELARVRVSKITCSCAAPE